MEELNNTSVEEEVSNVTEENKEETKETVKTFTQEDLDKILAKKFAQWQKKTDEAKLEAERKAKLTEAEKLAEERKEFEAMKKEFEYEKLINRASKTLSASDLPIEFADFLVAEDEEATTKRIDLFKETFNNAVEKLVNERLKGNVPKAAAKTNTGITKEQFNKMTYNERVKLFEENKELYHELTK